MDNTRMAMNTIAPVEEIRAHFPALERVYNGFPVAYFDGPGGTQVPRMVVEAMNDYLYNHNANTHWAYPTSHETDEIIARSRQTIGDFLNASPDEIVFGQNMTTLTFHLARSLGREWGAGDEIIVTELDHHANSDTWRSLEKDRGVTIRVMPMDIETGQLDLSDLADLLNEKTKLVAIGAASNILGTINDFQKAVAMAREAGALSFVDAVHYAAHELIDVKKIGCDFLACSAYKFYGPHIGILYGRQELLEAIDFPKLRPSPDYSPERMETGTQNHEGIAGAAAAVDFLASLTAHGTKRERLTTVFAEMHARQHELIEKLWNGLSAINGVTLYGPSPNFPRTSTVSFTIAGHNSENVARQLAEKGIFVSDGDFYALTVVERLAVGGLVRIGCSCYTTEAEIERLVEVVALTGQYKRPKQLKTMFGFHRDDPMEVGNMKIAVVNLTQGNINNNHFYLTSCMEMFPTSVIGGSSKSQMAPQLVELDVGLDESIETDIARDKSFFRRRSWVGLFFKHHNLRAGDSIVIEKLSDYRYRIHPQKLK